MPILADYEQFNGRYWETGTVVNHWAYRGVVAPHTGEPFSEALLLGMSGGIVMGYFGFAYDGYDPMARILTRNTTRCCRAWAWCSIFSRRRAQTRVWRIW